MFLPYVFWYNTAKIIFVDTTILTAVPELVIVDAPIQPVQELEEVTKPKGFLAFFELVFGIPADWIGSKIKSALITGLQIATVGFFASALLCIVSIVNNASWRKGWSGLSPTEISAYIKTLRILIPGIAIERRLRFYWLADGRLNWRTAPVLIARYSVAPTYWGKFYSIWCDLAKRGLIALDIGMSLFYGLKELMLIIWVPIVAGELSIRELLRGVIPEVLKIKDAHWYTTSKTKGISEIRNYSVEQKAGMYPYLNGVAGSVLPGSRGPRLFQYRM